MKPQPPVTLIGVVGGSGAGKSWFVERLCRLLGDKAAHLHLDNFYRDRSHLPPARRARLNFDEPDAIDWDEAIRVLRDCRAGQPTRVPYYDFATYSRIPERARIISEPRPVIFIDGLWLLLPPQVRALLDLKIYLDTPKDLRCARRRTRDQLERGYAPELIEQQLRTVLPMHDRYVEPQKKWADIIVRQPFREADLSLLAEQLWALLSHAGLMQPWEHATFRTELIDLLANHEYCA